MKTGLRTTDKTGRQIEGEDEAETPHLHQTGKGNTTKDQLRTERNKPQNQH
jgi:hypothetical protein